ncbi:MAG: dimethylarginine dimethylaminohydrolase family protein [Candidatus Acidiferrales bacterium]
MSAAKTFGGHSMVAPLRRVLLCSPRAAGWESAARFSRWSELGYAHEPKPAVAQAQFEALRGILEAAGAEVLRLAAGDDLSLDAVYVHDASFLTDHGALCLRMGKGARAAEPDHHRLFYRQQGIPVLGEILSPGLVEAGDLVWLDPSTVLAGCGLRTNAAGIEQLRTLLAPHGIEVVAAPLPYGQGPSACLHLMSLLSLLDARTALVDLPWLAVETVELLRSRGFTLVEIDPAERDTLACNVLALGDKVVLIFEENPSTAARLRQQGFTVKTVAGGELGINGGGGPTCLTRPLLRG